MTTAMRTELAPFRFALICVALLSLAGCGQSGALVLPGAVPAGESQDNNASDADEPEEDESGQ